MTHNFKSSDIDIKTAICTAWPLTEPHSTPSCSVDALVWFKNNQEDDNNNSNDTFSDSDGKSICVISKIKDTIQLAKNIRIIYVPASDSTEADNFNESIEDLISRAQSLDLSVTEKRMVRSFLAGKVVKQGCVINSSHQYASVCKRQFRY